MNLRGVLVVIGCVEAQEVHIKWMLLPYAMQHHHHCNFAVNHHSNLLLLLYGHFHSVEQKGTGGKSSFQCAVTPYALLYYNFYFFFIKQQYKRKCCSPTFSFNSFNDNYICGLVCFYCSGVRPIILLCDASMWRNALNASEARMNSNCYQLFSKYYALFCSSYETNVHVLQLWDWGIKEWVYIRSSCV